MVIFVVVNKEQMSKSRTTTYSDIVVDFSSRNYTKRLELVAKRCAKTVMR
jgi:hypothetical protein